MTKAERLAQIAAMLNQLTNDDPESAHNRADNLLIEALQAVGAHDVVRAYKTAQERVGFYYA